MDLKEKLKATMEEIKKVADSDDVFSIIKATVEELIEKNITGVKFQLSILFIQQELHKGILESQDYTEINNLMRGIEYADQIGNVLGIHAFDYNLN